MKSDKDFLQRLTALAQMCNFNLQPLVIEMYDRNLSPLGYDKLCSVIEGFIVNRKSRDPFPSIKEIKDKIILPVDPETESVEAAARIIQAISRYGWSNSNEARMFIGPLGWRTVERFGGWTTVCQTVSSNNISSLQAQFRNVAKAQAERALSGLDQVAPQIPAASENRTHDLVNASQVIGKLLNMKKDEEPNGEK